MAYSLGSYHFTNTFAKSVLGELLAADGRGGRQREGDQPLHLQPRSLGLGGHARGALRGLWHHRHEARRV